MEKQFLEAGIIARTHGVHGEVIINPWTDNADFLRQFKRFYIDGRPYEVRGARIHKGMLIAALEGVGDINAAAPLRGKTVMFDRAEASLEPGAFFIGDIIGARVVLEDGSELGVLKDALELPAGRVYIVRGEREHMIPAVPEFILETDVERQVITVRLIEGM